ncbi:MAG: sulfotransferase [Pseudomonadota bacterium]|nr:sulfotransferase [Pseudomonadota bacterium]
MKSPIFIFSLPRSGSTLLQRVLASHEAIASTAEPWIALPLIYMNRRHGSVAEYSSISAATAINDFISCLPEKNSDYFRELSLFLFRLYSLHCTNDEKYFLDKTPRYHFVIDDLHKLFPEAKFIYLFRNPINVHASMIKTWSSGRLNKMYRFYDDFTQGFGALSRGFIRYRERSYALNYEDFVQDPSMHLSLVCEYLDIEYDVNMLTRFSDQMLVSTMGDPTGTKLYRKVENNDPDAWKDVLNTGTKRRYMANLLKRVDEEAFSVQGYDKEKLLAELYEPCPLVSSISVVDIFDIFVSDMIRGLNLKLIFGSDSYYLKRYLS